MWPETTQEWVKYIVGALLTGLAVFFAMVPSTHDPWTLIPATGAAIVAYLMTMLGIQRPEVAKTERAKAIADIRRADREAEREKTAAKRSK